VFLAIILEIHSFGPTRSNLLPIRNFPQTVKISHHYKTFKNLILFCGDLKIILSQHSYLHTYTLYWKKIIQQWKGLNNGYIKLKKKTKGQSCVDTSSTLYMYYMITTWYYIIYYLSIILSGSGVPEQIRCRYACDSVLSKKFTFIRMD